MRLFTSVVIGVFILAPSSLFAEDGKLEFCPIAGFAMGWDDQLIASLTLRLVGNLQVTNPKCSSAFNQARNAGERMVKAKPFQPGDKELYQSYSAFKKRIDEAILRSAGY
jgi:hypothetical protein